MATENYLLSIQGTQMRSYNECVLCFQSAGLSSTDTLDAGGDLCNAFAAHATPLWLQCLPQTYELNQLVARRAFPKPSAEAHIQYQIGDNPGSSGPQATSLQLCPSVFLVPPMGTKSGGRIFMPSIAEGDIADNVYAGGYIANIDLLMGVLTTGMVGSGTNWKLGIYSRKNASVSLVQTWALSGRIGFQSRRRKPVGGY